MIREATQEDADLVAEAFWFPLAEEMEPYLKEPLSPGWKTVYALPKLSGASS